MFAESSATQTQTTKVQQLRAEVAAGRGSEEALRREENVLANMQAGLQVGPACLGFWWCAGVGKGMP